MPDRLLKDIKHRMEKAVEHVKHEMATIRTGRATPALVEDIKVDYYGTPTPLKQLATISVPDPRLIVIEPWDKTAIKEIEKAIQKSPLGLNPQNDGRVIKIPIPPLSEERRIELTKVVRKKAEEGRIAIRNLRREALEEYKKQEKEGTITEDDYYRMQKEVQHITEEYIKKVDEILEHKEKEILEE